MPVNAGPTDLRSETFSNMLIFTFSNLFLTLIFTSFPMLYYFRSYIINFTVFDNSQRICDATERLALHRDPGSPSWRPDFWRRES